MKYLVSALMIAALLWGCSEEPKNTIIYKRADTGDGQEGEDTGDGDTGEGDADADGDGDGDTDVDTDADSDGDGDYDSEDYQTLDSDEACGDWALELELHKSRIMILQDISYSMVDTIPTKWEQAREAMERLLATFGRSQLIDFGLDVFPKGGTDECGTTGPVVLDCAPDQTQLINDTLSSLQVYGATPLYRAMEKFTDPSYAPVFSEPEVDHYLVVITDGQDVCGADPDNVDPDGATAGQLSDVTESLQSGQNTMTVAIGFGDGVDPSQLNAIAAAGGTPFNEYLVAGNRTELEQAFVDIVALAISCRFDIDPQQLGSDEMDRDKVNFYFDGQTLPMDDDCAQGEGWTWVDAERTVVEFCEQACNMLKYGEVIEITGRFGCDTKVMVK